METSLLTLIIFLLSASTPEGFLQELCDNHYGTDGAIFWATHASSEVKEELADSDSLMLLLGNINELSVTPGMRTDFENTGDAFRIEYAESFWTWTDSAGSLHRVDGLTSVECRYGDYTWIQIPVLSSESTSISKNEKMIFGFLLSILLALFAIISLGWAKRRYQG